MNLCKTCFWTYPENYTHVAGERGIIVPVKITDQKLLDKYSDSVRKLGAQETKSRIEYAIIEFLEDMN